jgi:Flp pilus assembly protein TadD
MQEGVALLKMAAEKERNEVGYAEPPTYSRPESESLGYAYLRAREFQKARAAFQQELEERPNSGHALYGIAMSYELAGDRTEAKRAWAGFLASWKDADPDLTMVKHAQAALR